jgi:hypothetical protein
MSNVVTVPQWGARVDARSPAERRRARARAYRQRVAAGRIVVEVEICREILDAMITWGWLDERDAEDRAKIGRAIAAHLKAAARK